MVSTYLGYSMISRDIARSIERIGDQPMVKRETEYYLDKIEGVKSIDDFLGDDRLYRYAMKAFGLEDMTYAKAFMRKVLTEGVGSSDTFANSLTDKRYKEFAEIFNFAQFGETTTVFDRTRQGTVDRYMRQTLEEDAGSQNEGVRLALYFERKAPEIESVFSILADTALSKVVRTILGLPDSIATSDIDKQAAMIEDRIDIEEFKDPEALGKLLERFTSMWEISNPGTSTATPNIGILFGQPAELGISTDVMLTMQNLRF